MDLRRFIPFFDPSVQTWATEARILRWLTFLWLFVGLAILFSASYPSGIAKGDGLYYFKRQFLSAGLGLAGFHLVVHTPLRRLLAWGTPCFIVLLGLLFATHIPGLGTTAYGATRWLSLGPFPIQPSELLKPFLILQSAQVFGQWERLPWKVRWTWLGIFAIVLVGILAQPSLSTTALCGITLWLVALAAGLPYSYLWKSAAGGLIVAVVSISFNDYQQRRVMSFLNPWADPAQDGYQLIQSLLATGSGGTWGTGFGLSQQKWFYLPFQHTDFIFAVFAEEFGLVGSFLLLLLLTAYGVLAFRIATNSLVLVYRLVATGALVLIVGQSLLNIGVATGVLPTTGLPFPLFSYGGNSVISSLITAGLIVRVARENVETDTTAPDQLENSVSEGVSHRIARNGKVSAANNGLQDSVGSVRLRSVQQHPNRQTGIFSRKFNSLGIGTRKTSDHGVNRRSRWSRPPTR